jgi:DNA-binding transcriptional ArsR family regulator
MDTYHDKAKLLKLLAHPMRLQILDLVRRSDECVCHLSAVLDKPQPYVSQQLAILREAGLIIDRKEGTNVFYGLDDRDASGGLNAILGAIFAEHQVDAARGHQRVAGCGCPKCSGES